MAGYSYPFPLPESLTGTEINGRPVVPTSDFSLSELRSNVPKHRWLRLGLAEGTRCCGKLDSSGGVLNHKPDLKALIRAMRSGLSAIESTAIMCAPQDRFVCGACARIFELPRNVQRGTTL